MKANYSSDELLLDPGEMENRALLVNSLAARLHPAALGLLTSSVNALTASNCSALLCEEASTLLADLVAELSPEEVEFESRKLAADLADSLTQQFDTPVEATGWISSRAQDLALDLASFWAGLADQPEARKIACQELLAAPVTRRALATLGNRYYLTVEQAAELVRQVQALHEDSRYQSAAA